MASDDEEGLQTDLFQEPEGYYQPEKPATYAEHVLKSGQVVKLRLVGHNPLWVHFHLLQCFYSSSFCPRVISFGMQAEQLQPI